jgi:beta-glucosidase
VLEQLCRMQKNRFGENFLWGTAIAAAQNEGAWNIDGRGPSIWDAFARKHGKIKGGARPTHNTGFYYHYKQDLLLAKALGFNSFRFSISWSRIFPNGGGRPNKEGVAFYHQLIEECLKLHLTPLVTLYHWDLPQALEKEGGWCSHLMINWFQRYANFCATEFGPTVKHWLILNEPMGFTSLGYMLGKHAPGKTGINNFFPAVHNAVICQADGGRILRAEVNKAHIGTSFSCSEIMSASQKPEDKQAANRIDILLNRLFIEPTLGRGYPQENGFILLDKLHLHSKAWKYTQRMQFNFDFIGLQNYFPVTVQHHPLIPYIQAKEVPAKTRKVPVTQLGWEVNPESFYRMIKRYWLYGSIREIMITENGACYTDSFVKGAINDPNRIAYFENYLAAALKAKTEGVNLSGYFAWTLTDNFEWNHGFKAPFGLIHVDFNTQKRTIKQSGYWWRDWLIGRG